MHRCHHLHESIRLLIVISMIGFFGGLIRAQETRVLRVISGFEEGVNLSPINYWRWSEEEKQSAASYSGLELARVPGASGRALKITVMKPLPGGLDFYALWSTGLDYLPPETTGIRLRARVVSGRFTLSVGGPTVYFGTSDVQSPPRVLEAGEDWQTVEFRLTDELDRNYRRPVFSQESPVIYYTRWIQEPMRILIGADSRGELWLDDVELIASGEGRPYPVFAEDEVATLSTAELGKAFTFATDEREIMALALVSPYRQRREDTIFSIEKIEAVSVPEGERGSHVSFPQVPDLTRVGLEKSPGAHGLRARQRVESPAP